MSPAVLLLRQSCAEVLPALDRQLVVILHVNETLRLIYLNTNDDSIFNLKKISIFSINNTKLRIFLYSISNKNFSIRRSIICSWIRATYSVCIGIRYNYNKKYFELRRITFRGFSSVSTPILNLVVATIPAREMPTDPSCRYSLKRALSERQVFW